MAQRFLHDWQHIALMRGGDVQHVVRVQAGAGEAGGKQVCGGGAPEHGAMQPGQDAGHEQRGAGGLDFIWPAACHFMQGAEGQPGLGQMRIQGGHAERVCAAGPRGGPFQKPDAAAQGGKVRGHVPYLFP